MNVLVTGGAGYIGSHAVEALKRAGHRPIVLDDLSRGHREAVPTDVPLVVDGLRDRVALRAILREHRIECVMHFAAFAYVGESVEEPLRYYENNTSCVVTLLSAMKEEGVRRFVFSSTCATYGEPDRMPITEGTPQRPINAYGWSKLFVERILSDVRRSDPGFAFAALRYFNVAGCSSDGGLGEDHEPETHLIPILLEVALGQRASVTIFGDDYATPDGTCIRDYIHVEDLVEAHVTVLERLSPGDARFYNLGIGRGYSVREVLEAARRVTGHAIPATVGPRRPGDPPALYADASRIASELGWRARHTDLDGIVESAWRWFQAHPTGYRK